MSPEALTPIFFFYGLSFFLMGLVILFNIKSAGSYKIGKYLYLLAWFGFLHGVNEWIDMFLNLGDANISHETLVMLEHLRFFILPMSFVFLMQFGAKTIAAYNINFGKLPKITLLYFACYTVVLVLSLFLMNEHPILELRNDIFTRYFLAFPASIFTAMAFYFAKNSFEIKNTQNKRIEVYFYGSIIVFLAYAFFAGIIVPKDDFFPASFLNYSLFLNVFSIPIQLLRMIAAIFIAYFIVQMMNVFKIKTEKLPVALEKLHIFKEDIYEIIEAIRIPIIITTADFKIKLINDSAVFLLGYQKKELEDQFIDKIMEEKECITNIDKNCSAEKTFITKNGKKVPVCFSFSVTKDDKGNPEYIVCTAYDITSFSDIRKKLSYQYKLEEQVSDVLKQLDELVYDDIEGGIERTLHLLANFAAVDMVNIFLVKGDTGGLMKKYEYCADEFKLTNGKYSFIKKEEAPWLLEKLKHERSVLIPDVKELPSLADSERQFWLSQGIKSILLIPIFFRGRLIGFVSFMAIKTLKSWEKTDIPLLNIYASALTAVFELNRVISSMQETV